MKKKILSYIIAISILGTFTSIQAQAEPREPRLHEDTDGGTNKKPARRMLEKPKISVGSGNRPIGGRGPRGFGWINGSGPDGPRPARRNSTLN